MGVLPEGWEKASGGGAYTRLEQGENKFRVLGQAVGGFEWWVEEDGKRRPVRVRFDSKERGPDYKTFIALPVWNYQTEKVEILQINQKTIQKQLASYEAEEDWGDLTYYDIKITKEGSGLKTNYTVNPMPVKLLADKVVAIWEETNLNLEALFDGGNPFQAEF